MTNSIELNRIALRRIQMILGGTNEYKARLEVRKIIIA